MACPAHRHERRTFIGMLTVGLAATLAGCAQNPDSAPPVQPLQPIPPSGNDTVEPAPVSPSAPPSPLPGGATVLSRGPAGTQQIALTVDDGFCEQCVGGYVDFAVRTGTHLTFSPNGIYNATWGKHAAPLKPLIERGQVQIMNHTFSHKDLRKLNENQIRDELDKNDDWVNKTFGISTRPYYRPPFGFHDPQVDGAAARAGYPRTVLWNGSYGDARLLKPDVLMGEAKKWLRPGTIMLGHANHPTVLGLFDQIQELIKQRNLQPVTLDEMFGTTRAEARP